MLDARGAAAIVGVGQTAMGEAVPDRSVLELTAEASVKALADAGLKLSDVDGVFAAQGPGGIAEYLGLRPRYVDGTSIGGSSYEAHCISASLAIAHGLCDVALIPYASTQRTGTVRRNTGPRTAGPTGFSGDLHTAPYKPRMPMNAYALAAARHMHEYGTTHEQLAAVAVAARKWANLNPDAFMHGELSISDVTGSRPVCDPFTVRDCCLVTDGAGAVVMTSAERAKDLPQKPMYFLGGNASLSHSGIAFMEDLTVSAAARSGPRAFELAGMKPSDIDVLALYDAFTINTILFLEDLGYCEKGEGGAFVESGAIDPGGSLAVNTNGGGLSCVHPGMYGLFLLIEATHQIRGDAGERQVEGAKAALCHGNGGILSTQVTTIWGAEETL